MSTEEIFKSNDYKEFIEYLSLGTGRYKKYDVFYDFVTVTALGISNKFKYREDDERYISKILEKYKDEEKVHFLFLSRRLKKLQSKSNKAIDILGHIFSDIYPANEELGQYFTPPHIAEFMAYTLDIDEKLIKKNGFVDVKEPSCRFWCNVFRICKFNEK